MNLSDFRNAVAGSVGMDVADSTELALIDRWINEAVVDVLRKTRCYQVQTTISLTAAGAGDYDLPASILQIEEIWIDLAQYGSMDHVSLNDLLRQRAVQSADYVSRYTVAGANRLMVWPIPTVDTVATAIVVPRPTKLTDPSDDPSNISSGGIPEELHVAIEHKACQFAATYRRDASSNNGEYFRTLYEQDITENVGLISRKGGARNFRAKPGYRRNTGALSNGIYPRA